MKRIVNIVHCHFESPAVLRAWVRNLFFVTLCCLFSLSLAAQQNNSLRGKILFLNSDKSPAVGVKIEGSIKIDSTTTLTANSVYTAADGSYTLVFPKVAPGHVVELKVAGMDGNGQVLEIVNEEELRIFRIPEDPAEEFNIIVCKKGERDIAAKKYYNVLKTSAERELEKMKKRWSTLVAQSEKDYKKINTMSKRIDALQKQTDSLNLYKDALRIASINKDNATKRVLRYLKLLDEGTSIQEARKELSINKAINELEVGLLRFNAAVTELQTRADASKSMFDYKDAIKCYDTLIHYADKMGVDRLKMTGYYEEIASVTLDDGDYATALSYHQKTMAIREAILEPKHLDLAVSYGRIAIIYEYLGQYKTALEYAQKAISIAEIILNSKHPALGFFYENIGHMYHHLGQDSIALTYQQKAIAIQEEILEPKHPNLVIAYNNIAGTYQTLGQYEKALEYLQKAMTIREETLDSKHPALSTSYGNISTIYMDLSQYEKALEYGLKAIDIQEAVLDPKHPTLSTSYNNIGIIYNDLFQYEKALKYRQKAMKIWEEILDPKHPHLAIAYNNIALTYQALGEYEITLKYHQKAIAIREEILGPKHPHLVVSYDNIGTTYEFFGQYEKALEYKQKAIAIQKEILDPKHPTLAKLYNNIGVTYQALGQYGTALKYQQKAVAILEKVLDPKHPNLGFSYGNIAVTYKEMKNFQKAITFQEKYLAILKEALPKSHPRQDKALHALADIYGSKASYNYNNKDYVQAIKAYKKSVTISSKTKKKHFHYNNLGLAYVKNKQFKEAREAFSEYEKLFPKKGTTYRNWAMYYALQNDKEKAMENLKKAVELGYNDLEWLKTDDSMENLKDEKAFMEIIAKMEQSKKK